MRLTRLTTGRRDGGAVLHRVASQRDGEADALGLVRPSRGPCVRSFGQFRAVFVLCGAHSA